MKTIWLVLGQCGEYDDFHEWAVAAYATYEEAEKHREAAQKCVEEMADTMRKRMDAGDPMWWQYEPNPYDEHCDVRTSEPTTYVLDEIPFFETFVPVVQQDRAQSSEG